MSDFARYRTDHLMLLLGTNPLPLFVAAQLLAPQPIQIHVVVSSEILQLGIPGRLLTLLGRNPEDHSQYVVVEPSNPRNIFQVVQAHIRRFTGSWGLNYTGGRKSMAVHTYRAVEQALASRSKDIVFSYLDADTLEMVIEHNGEMHRPSAHLEIEVSIEQILELHNFPLSKTDKPEDRPFQAEFTRQMVDYCQDKNSRTAWLKWAAENLKTVSPKTGKPEALSNPQAREVKLPQDIPMIGGQKLGEVSQAWERKACSLAKWLHGYWLEDYVLAEAQNVREQARLHQVVRSVRPASLVGFDIDVVAMQGYRLFALSVTTEDEEGLAKLKLFEAMIRARQIGGDEARIGLICFTELPEKMEKQVGELLYTEASASGSGQAWRAPVKVFGIDQLPKLSLYLQNWFKEVK